MRLSTSMMFERSQNSMQSRQSDLSKVGEQMASGKRVVSPSDDPRASAQALIIKQDQAVQEQYKNSRTSATSVLEAQDNTLDSVNKLLYTGKGLVVQAGNGALSDSDRASVATQLEGLYNQLTGLANGKDSNGQYMFSGSKGDVQPFTAGTDATGGFVMNYAGDGEPLNMQVDASRLMNVNATGTDVFRVPATAEGDAESDLFTAFQTAITALRTPQTPGNQDALRADLDKVNRQLDVSLDNVGSVQTSIGSKLNELDILGNIGASRTISNNGTLSDLQDLDYAEAISSYTLAQIGLEASKKIFMQVQQTSLFDLVR